MSNHWHAVVTDMHARLPEFLERFHRLVARALNAAQHRSENFWSSEKTSVVHLATDGTVLEKMAYVIANPVLARLVQNADEWPGVVSSHRLDKSWAVAMPRVFFNAAGKMSKTANLKITRPKIYAGLSGETIDELLRERVAQIEKSVRDEASTIGHQFLGSAAVLRQSQKDVPKSPKSRWGIKPRVAATDTTARIDAINGLRAFERAYRAAWLKWKAGLREVLFPAGTYWLRVHAGVLCSTA